MVKLLAVGVRIPTAAEGWGETRIELLRSHMANRNRRTVQGWTFFFLFLFSFFFLLLCFFLLLSFFFFFFFLNIFFIDILQYLFFIGHSLLPPLLLLFSSSDLLVNVVPLQLLAFLYQISPLEYCLPFVQNYLPAPHLAFWANKMCSQQNIQ